MKDLDEVLTERGNRELDREEDSVRLSGLLRVIIKAPADAPVA
jgi:hypothetical protein